MGSFFKITDPCQAIVTIVEHRENDPFAGQSNMHHGILHSMNNDEKNYSDSFLQQSKD